MRSRVTTRNRQEPLEDEELQQLIMERIEEDPVFWTGSGRRRTYVTVEVEDGHVVLSGLVRSPLDRRRADILARALGAQSVDNRLGIVSRPPARDSQPPTLTSVSPALPEGSSQPFHRRLTDRRARRSFRHRLTRR